MARTANRHKLDAKSPKKIVWNIGFYIRLSREDKRNLQESESITNQKLILHDWLDNQDDGFEYVFVGYYEDDGVSGTTDEERPGFQRLLVDIEAGKVNCVIVKNLARSFRNLADQSYYLEEYFFMRNVRFISLFNQTMDTFLNKRSAGDMGVKFQGMSNEAFVQQTSESVRATFDTKRRNGEFIGAFAPYGYLKDPENKNRLIIDPEICALKREMRNWIVHEGLSFRGVAKRLNERGIPNPGAYKRSQGLKYCSPQMHLNLGMWEGQTVKRVLVTETNLGHMVQGKQRVASYKIHDRLRVPEDEWFIKENTHEPTFTQEEYDELLSFSKRDTRTPNGAKQVHMFAGFLRCRDCDRALQRRGAKNHVYYACRTNREKSLCTNHSIRLDKLENVVLAAIKLQIELVGEMAKAVEQINQKPSISTQSSRLEDLLNARQNDLAKFKDTADHLYLDLRAELITIEDYKRMKAKFDSQIEQTTQIIEGLEEDLRIANQGVTADDELFSYFLQHKSVEKLDRGLLLSLIDTIYLHEDQSLTIRYRFESEFQRAADFITENIEDYKPKKEQLGKECAS